MGGHSGLALGVQSLANRKASAWILLCAQKKVSVMCLVWYTKANYTLSYSPLLSTTLSAAIRSTTRLSLGGRLRATPSICDDYPEYPAIHQEETKGCEPQPWQKSAPPQKFQLVALLQPCALSDHPQDQRGKSQPLIPEEGRSWEIEREQDHVPEKVLSITFPVSKIVRGWREYGQGEIRGTLSPLLDVPGWCRLC